MAALMRMNSSQLAVALTDSQARFAGELRALKAEPRTSADYSGRALPVVDAEFEPPNAWGLKPKPKPDWENPYNLKDPPHKAKIHVLDFRVPTPPGIDIEQFEPPNPYAADAKDLRSVYRARVEATTLKECYANRKAVV
jgi:hypothetical protein